MSHSSTSVLQNFSFFYEFWLTHHEILLHQLLEATNSEKQEQEEEKLMSLINEVLSHYKRYYHEQSLAAKEDVLQVLSPPWLSSYERSLLWICGLKPSIIFRLLNGAVVSETQAERLERVKRETRRRERELTEAMARVQERVAEPPIVGVVRRVGREMDGEITEMETAVEELKRAMRGVLERADRVRMVTMKKVMEILTPFQMVKLFVAAAEYQLRVRRWGVERDLQRST